MSKVVQDTVEYTATVYIGSYWRDPEYEEYKLFPTLEEAVEYVLDNLPVEDKQWYKNDFNDNTINVNVSSWSGGYVRRKEIDVEAKPKVDVTFLGEEE